MYYMTTHPSPIGLLTLASDGAALMGLWIEGQKYHGDTIPGMMTEKDELPIFDMVKKWLDRYFMGDKPAIYEIPLSPHGSDFQKRVWNILCEIPYGKVTTYGEIARSLAKEAGKEKMSGQAVGGAVGHNPISIIIPCHRVVGSNGNLTGYSGGIAVKIKLLQLEGVDMTHLFAPSKGTAPKA